MSKLVPIKKFTAVIIGEYNTTAIRTARQAATEYAYQLTLALKCSDYEETVARSGMRKKRNKLTGSYDDIGYDPFYERAYRRSLVIFKRYLQ